MFSKLNVFKLFPNLTSNVATQSIILLFSTSNTTSNKDASNISLLVFLFPLCKKALKNFLYILSVTELNIISDFVNISVILSTIC